MDDNGRAREFCDGDKFRITPKGFYIQQFVDAGLSREDASEEWHRFEAFA